MSIALAHGTTVLAKDTQSWLSQHARKSIASNQHVEALSHTTAQGTSSHLLPHETYSKVIINQTRPYMIDHGLRGALEWQK